MTLLTKHFAIDSKELLVNVAQELTNRPYRTLAALFGIGFSILPTAHNEHNDGQVPGVFVCLWCSDVSRREAFLYIASKAGQTVGLIVLIVTSGGLCVPLLL